MFRRRYRYLALIATVIVAGSLGGYVYVLPFLSPSHAAQGTGNGPMTVIHIPPRSNYPPQGWSDILGLNSSGFQPRAFTVVVGVNNTIEWINDDTIDHSVVALAVPQGASLFDSGFFGHGAAYTVTLTVPGIYKYDCAWHPWLAGIITVKLA